MAIARGFRSAVSCFAKQLFTDRRLPSCQKVLKVTPAAVPNSTPAALCKGSAVGKRQALHSSASDFAVPAAAKIQGTWHYQQHWMCRFSTQHPHTQQEGPDISLLSPALQEQWDHAANAHLGNIIIKPQSARKAHWICRQCPDGYLHSWTSSVYNRTNGRECPQCSGHKVCKHNSLATKAPGVAAQWDYEENDGTPDTTASQSNHNVGWLCDVCGHKWSAKPGSRVSKRKSGCPQCALPQKWSKRPTFAESQHPLLAEWDHKRNSYLNLFPHTTRLQSNKQIWWLCAKCPAGQEHSWSAAPKSRTGSSKTGCPVCFGRAACRCNSLQALYPDIAAEWEHAKNRGHPSNYTASSRHEAWWLSPQRGSWQQMIQSRTNQTHHRVTRQKHKHQRQADAFSWLQQQS